MPPAKPIFWSPSSPTAILPTPIGCGLRQTTCASPPRPQSNAPKAWPPPAPEERFNDQCGAGALAREMPEVEGRRAKASPFDESVSAESLLESAPLDAESGPLDAESPHLHADVLGGAALQRCGK